MIKLQALSPVHIIRYVLKKKKKRKKVVVSLILKKKIADRYNNVYLTCFIVTVYIRD